MTSLFGLIEASGIDMTTSVRVAASSHTGASYTDKNLARWTPPKASADADLLPDLDTLVARTRDASRNSGLASGGNQTLVDNIVGTGPRLSAIPDYRALGQTKEWAEEFSGIVEAFWRGYSETGDCDAAGMMPFGAQAEQVLRSAIMNGEGLVLPLWLPDPRSKFSTRFLHVEPDRLSNPHNQMDSEFRRAGIEIDKYGRPLAYWIQKNHPGDWYALMGAIGGEWERVPAETPWGRKRVIHIHDKERTGQSRGKPWWSSVLPEFKMLDQYTRAELKSAIVSALVAAFIETPLDSATLAQAFGADPTSAEYQKWLETMRSYVAPLDGGAMIPMVPGTKVNPFNPARPSDAFEPFVTNVYRRIGLGLNLPLELFTKDFSKTNYSSARAALLEAWRFFRGRRQWLANYWLRPAYTLWLEEAVNLGLVDAPDFYENIAAYTRSKWIWPGRGWIDPVKEAEAAQVRLENNLSTLEDECAEQGLDWEEVLEQRAKEAERMKQLGLNPAPARVRSNQNQPEEQAA